MQGSSLLELSADSLAVKRSAQIDNIDPKSAAPVCAPGGETIVIVSEAGTAIVNTSTMRVAPLEVDSRTFGIPVWISDKEFLIGVVIHGSKTQVNRISIEGGMTPILPGGDGLYAAEYVFPGRTGVGFGIHCGVGGFGDPEFWFQGPEDKPATASKNWFEQWLHSGFKIRWAAFTSAERKNLVAFVADASAATENRDAVVVVDLQSLTYDVLHLPDEAKPFSVAIDADGHRLYATGYVSQSGMTTVELLPPPPLPEFYRFEIGQRPFNRKIEMTTTKGPVFSGCGNSGA